MNQKNGDSHYFSKGLLFWLIALFPALCNAQTYPVKPVRIVVTFTQGGAADFTARLIGDRFSELWKQQVIVENRIGAGGNIGTEAVYKAPADGYTLLLVASAQAFNVALYPKLPFDLLRDFVPLGLATSTPMALAVHPRVQVASLKEYTEMMQSRPGQLSYATCGVATAHHFAMELYKFRAKGFALHIPYRGCAAAVLDTVGGQIDTVMSSLNTVLPHAKSGKLRVLAITSKNRSPSAPDVPTFSESGIPALADYQVDVYYGFMARSGTPKEALARIEGDLRSVLAMPEVRQRIAAAGLDLFVTPPDEMGALMRADVDKFRKVIDYAGIRPE
jgi:tripartite-type tricarboxylate transporter receptor subunit TctC